MKTILVNFPTSKKDYAYKFLDGISEGGIVVVDTRNGISIATVVKVSEHDYHAKLATRHIVQKVDTSDFIMRIEKDKKVQSIKGRMEALQKKLEKEAVFKMLAESNEEMRTLYEELKTLQ